MHLKFFFGAISKLGFVLQCFGSSIIIPLLKDKSGNVNDVVNYRAVSLIRVISKLFEVVILKIGEDSLVTD